MSPIKTHCLGNDSQRENIRMMEQTVTQNGALYFAQHKASPQRAALFRKFGRGVKKQLRVNREQQAISDLFLWSQLRQKRR